MEAGDRGRDGRPRLVMLGPSPEHPGGITKVVESWRGAGLDRLVSLREIHTGRWDDPRWRQLPQGVGALLTLLLVLLRRQADVVYVHVSTGGSVVRKLLASLLCRLFGVPFVVQIHSGSYEAWVEESRFARACSRSLMAHAALAVVVAARWSELARRLGAEQVLVLPNALSRDEREALAAPTATPPERPTLLYYGRWSPVKGPDRIAAALAVATASGSGATGAYEVRLFGNGDRAWLERAFAVLPDECVTIGPWIGLEVKASELAGATTLIVPSRAEGFGQVLLEARAAGTPVIACDVGAVSEILAGYEPALLLTAGDDGALAHALSRVLAGEWPPAGERAPDLPEGFWAERAVEELVAALEELAADGSLVSGPQDSRETG